jgi:hypothetical protein
LRFINTEELKSDYLPYHLLDPITRVVVPSRVNSALQRIDNWDDKLTISPNPVAPAGLMTSTVVKAMVLWERGYADTVCSRFWDWCFW